MLARKDVFMPSCLILNSTNESRCSAGDAVQPRLHTRLLASQLAVLPWADRGGGAVPHPLLRRGLRGVQEEGLHRTAFYLRHPRQLGGFVLGRTQSRDMMMKLCSRAQPEEVEASSEFARRWHPPPPPGRETLTVAHTVVPLAALMSRRTLTRATPQQKNRERCDNLLSSFQLSHHRFVISQQSLYFISRCDGA